MSDESTNRSKFAIFGLFALAVDVRPAPGASARSRVTSARSRSSSLDRSVAADWSVCATRFDSRVFSAARGARRSAIWSLCCRSDWFSRRSWRVV